MFNIKAGVSVNGISDNVKAFIFILETHAYGQHFAVFFFKGQIVLSCFLFYILPNN